MSPPGPACRRAKSSAMCRPGTCTATALGWAASSVRAFGLGWALPRVDEAVSALLLDLEQRGLLATTLVVMVGEFGRSPKLVRAGRDHWPSVYSALLAGAGVRGGTVYGASDKIGGYVRDNPVSPED